MSYRVRSSILKVDGQSFQRQLTSIAAHYFKILRKNEPRNGFLTECLRNNIADVGSISLSLAFKAASLLTELPSPMKCSYPYIVLHTF